MILNKYFWNNKYKNSETRWDIGFVSTPLKEYFNQLTDKTLKILIPGCGNSYEAEYLYNLGFTNVFVADYSEIALKNFINRVPNFPEDNLLCMNFFNIRDSYDLIIEQTFFCAIDISKRTDYVNKIYELLSYNGKLVGLLFINILSNDHPPFGGDKLEYEILFSDSFDFITFEISNNSINKRSGRELFINFQKK